MLAFLLRREVTVMELEVDQYFEFESLFLHTLQTKGKMILNLSFFFTF
jgi:hypothetical protein